MIKRTAVLAPIYVLIACTCAEARGPLPIGKIKLPPGFKIEVYADDVPNARSMTQGKNGTLFAGTRERHEVYAITGGGKKVQTIARGLHSPNGVAFKDGALFIAEQNRISRLDDIENHLADPPKPATVYDKLPNFDAHGWKFIAFGPDGLLYVPIGAPCNICEIKDPFASITRMKADGTGFEIYARGVRNTVGFTWHPETKVLHFTDNGRDNLGDDLPPDELNQAKEAGMHFGYPFCHGGTIPDPEYGKTRKCSEFTPPYVKLGPHVAGLGLRFYTGKMFPPEYNNRLFIAEHGSWNRSTPLGSRVMMVTDGAGGGAPKYEVFAEGWLGANGEAWGRPVDIEVPPDGALLVSDDKAGAIYRISYSKP